MLGDFLRDSDTLDIYVLRPLSHLSLNWELMWDGAKYVEEENAFGHLINELAEDLDQTAPLERYHDSEEALAEYVIRCLGWPISKANGRWHGADYGSILHQGGFDDGDQQELILAAAGRIKAATDRGQMSFDGMEESHRRVLATVLSSIIDHRLDFETDGKVSSRTYWDESYPRPRKPNLDQD